MSTIFKKIIDKEIKIDIVYEDDFVVAFNDINPIAPIHILIIPKKEIATLNNLEDDDAELMGKLIIAAKNIAKIKNIATDGYRIVFNCNQNGGQSVFHIHCHLIGGRMFYWPPG